MNNIIYLDHHSTTPLDRKVLDKMIPFFSENFGNPSSIDHYLGNKAQQAVESCRIDIVKNIGAKYSKEIIFTSGATEANNLALIGLFNKYSKEKNHIISTVIEHKSILDTLKYLETLGAEVTLLPVDKTGLIDLKELEDSIKDNTLLISIMYANNEIGTIQPINAIGEISRRKKIYFHCDAAQAMGYENINVYENNIDLLSISAHKFYGPKGVGCLFLKSFNPTVRLNPIVHGGGQERGFRSGTLNVPGIVGLSEALNLVKNEQRTEKDRLEKMRNEIQNILLNECSDIKLNGHPQRKLPNNMSITIPGIESKALIHNLNKKMAFSTGSACSTTKAEPSHVLKAIGLTDDECHQTIRIGLGRSNVDSIEISDKLIKAIKELKC